jgi:TPR repeat protein
MANWRSVALLVIGVVILLTASWAYRGVELLEGKAAFAAKNYPRAAAALKPFSGWHDPEAQAALGDMYANGLGVKEDDAKAFALATASANTGLAYAETLLGTLYQQGKGTNVDDTQAAFWFRQAALQGNADAQTKLGEAYVMGIGVGQDYGQAASLFAEAADQADAVAQYDLGRLYVIGLGEPRDDGQAASLFQRSAALGNLDAQIQLGILYHAGAGVPRDDAKAVTLFRPGAVSGKAVAEYYLGLAYAKGEGVAADPAQAITWLQRAAIQGNAAAQLALGQVYTQPGTEDAVLAAALFDLAAAQDSAAAKAAAAALAQEMTPAQAAKGAALAGRWTVNTPLPATSFEDKAPQLVLGMDAKPAVYQASKIWFSRGFALAGLNWHVAFIATQGKTCHGCGEMIGAATFWSGGPNADAGSAGQAGFTTFGADGAVPAEDASGARAALVQPMAADRVAVLVPVTSTADEVFGFALADPADPKSGAWRDLGKIVTAGGDTACAAPCAAWQGAVSVVPAVAAGWPDLAVKAAGSVMNAAKTLVAAPDELYRFNGKGYALVPAAMKS